MVDVHSTDVLNRVVDNQPDRTDFLTTMFFPEVIVSDEETILFDITNGRKLITPYVSPLAEGRLVADLGYETDSLRPAYVKDKRVFDPKKGQRRLPGEKIGGELTPEQRLDRAIKANLNEQIDMMKLRQEQQAGEILRLGTVTISGERYPSRTVDFRRRAENRVVKTGGARWGQVGVVPWDDIDAEAQELSDATGYGATDVIFDPLAWKLFKPSIPKDAIDKTLANGDMVESLMGYVKQPRDGVAYRGKSGYLRFWTYTGSYTDPEDGATKKMLGDYEVLIGSSTLDGVRHFGAIQDLEAGLQARQYFVKSELKFDPSRRIYLMQQAPLLVPYRRNNVKSIKVN